MKRISNKIMRNKDFASLKERHHSYRKWWNKKGETLYKTPRGFFFCSANTTPYEVSVTSAADWMAQNHIRYNTGW